MQMIRPLSILGALAAISLGCGTGGEPSPPQLLEDLTFLAFLDGDTEAEPIELQLSDYFAENRPGTRILLINAAAGWCIPCMREAAAITEFAALYEPRGVAILVDVFQDQSGAPAGPDFVRAWIDAFGLSVPVLIDTDFQTSRYFNVNAMPASLLVDAETLEILQIAVGAETGADPMKEYRELLDHYLQ
jgi:thiol-disulfide isomerase/thioredoxin